MFTRFHGIDRHKKYSTVSVLDHEGRETRFLRSCQMEASCGSFYWADRVEATGAICFVLDPMRFRIITDSWNKTDRQDARNMAKALWVFLVTGEFGIPTVYKPSEVIRTPRRLFASYKLLNRQIRMLKNTIQAMLTEDGVTLSANERSRLFKGKESVAEILADRRLSEVIVEALQIQADLLRTITESKNVRFPHKAGRLLQDRLMSSHEHGHQWYTDIKTAREQRAEGRSRLLEEPPS